jgi:hypothetical protein
VRDAYSRLAFISPTLINVAASKLAYGIKTATKIISPMSTAIIWTLTTSSALLLDPHA